MEESRSQTVTTKICPANGSLLPWLHLVHPPVVVHGPRCHRTHPKPFFRGVDLLVPLNVRGDNFQAPIGQTSDLHGSFFLGVEGVDHDILESRLGLAVAAAAAAAPMPVAWEADCSLASASPASDPWGDHRSCSNW